MKTIQFYLVFYSPPYGENLQIKPSCVYHRCKKCTPSSAFNSFSSRESRVVDRLLEKPGGLECPTDLMFCGGKIDIQDYV